MNNDGPILMDLTPDTAPRKEDEEAGGILGKFEPKELPKEIKAFLDFIAEIDREYNHKLYLAPQKMDQFETFTLYTLEGREDTEVDGVKCDLLCCIDEDMYWENPYKIGLQSPHVILTLDTDKIEDLREVLDRYVPQLWKAKKEKGDNRS